MIQQLADPIRIQIVEDERIVAMDLSEDLESLGYVVTGIAASEARSIELAKLLRPDLILMDINLGRGGDGTLAARVLMDELKIPVIYLTAYAEPETLNKAGKTAPYGYLLKPFELRELNATIRMAHARRGMEQSVERAEQRFRLALDAAQLGVVEFHPESDEIQMHGHLDPLLFDGLQGFSLSRQEFLGHLDEDVRERLGSLLQPGGTAHVIGKWHGDDGVLRWVEIHACHFLDEGKIVGVLRDVSLQMESAEQLRKAAVVFESAADAIVILDENSQVRAINPAFAEMTGWSLDEIAGQKAQGLLHVRRRDDWAQFAASALASPRQREVVCRRKDGSQFPAWEHVSPVLDEYGALRHLVLTFTDISALRRAESQIQHQAFHDALTGLGNRHHLEDSLRRFIGSNDAAGESVRFALIFIDLDGFKTINDTLGHSVGDELLVTIARRLEQCLRKSDVAVRLGGDEFVVLVSEVGEAADVEPIALKILSAIRHPVSLAQGEPVAVSASLGGAVFPDHASTATELVKAADAAMYAAKAAGRNRYEIYNHRLADKAIERLQIEQGLRRAKVGEEILLHWQPIVDLRTERVIGAEALMRWNHPEFGAISPERFIPVAEDIGLIEELGRWALNEACRLGAAWLRMGLPLERLAVNVSARQLVKIGFVGSVEQALRTYGFPAACLELELTESTLQSVDSSRRVLAELRELGVKVAIDDFGTGFSCLSMLKYFPLDRLKIDKSFVRDVDQDANDVAIVKAVLALANALGLAVTAEGVETPAQRDMLKALGAHDAQGWLYSPAVPPEAFPGVFLPSLFH
jgi:diguanylate cyclase (GGDEF)-like protein/PAS domain S-box-containing protein